MGCSPWEPTRFLILFSTLGGILAFGPLGFMIGPIVAGLFVTSWEIFAVAYSDVLEERVVIVDPSQSTAASKGPASYQIER